MVRRVDWDSTFRMEGWLVERSRFSLQYIKAVDGTTRLSADNISSRGRFDWYNTEALNHNIQDKSVALRDIRPRFI